MTEFTMDRLRENLEALKMKNTLEILDNYLERAVAENLNIVEVLDHIFSEEAKSKRRRAYEKQIQMSGFPIKKTLDDFDFSFQPSIDKRQIDELATMRFLENGENVVFLGPPGVGKTHLASALGLVAAQHRFSTYYINCHQLIEQLKKAHFENRLPDKLKVLAKYRMLIIDEIGYLPMDIQGANLFFQLIARRYEKTSTVFMLKSVLVSLGVTSIRSMSRWMAFSSALAFKTSSHALIWSTVKSVGGVVSWSWTISALMVCICSPISATTVGGKAPVDRFFIRASYSPCFASMRLWRALLKSSARFFSPAWY